MWIDEVENVSDIYSGDKVTANKFIANSGTELLIYNSYPFCCMFEVRKGTCYQQFILLCFIRRSELLFTSSLGRWDGLSGILPEFVQTGWIQLHLYDQQSIIKTTNSA